MTGVDAGELDMRREVGRRTRLRRIWLERSQDQVATKAGVTRNFVSAVERGGQGLDAWRLRLLADALGVSLLWLLTGPDPKPATPLAGRTESRCAGAARPPAHPSRWSARTAEGPSGRPARRTADTAASSRSCAGAGRSSRTRRTRPGPARSVPATRRSARAVGAAGPGSWSSCRCASGPPPRRAGRRRSGLFCWRPVRGVLLAATAIRSDGAAVKAREATAKPLGLDRCSGRLELSAARRTPPRCVSSLVDPGPPSVGPPPGGRGASTARSAARK
jgi:transcriptional regulator with XRE-family HTH domain